MMRSLFAALLFLTALTLAGCGGQVAAPKQPVQQVASPEMVEVSEEAVPEKQPVVLGAPLKVAVVSDLNGRYGSKTYGKAVHRAVDRLHALQPDLVLSAGDMVAGQKAGLDYPGMWAGFHEAFTHPLASAGIPLAVSPGNHDASGYPAFEEERVHYAEAWSESNRPDLNYVDDENYPFYYAFEAKGALFVALDITMSEPMDRPQRVWLDELLERASRETIVVFGHVPLVPFADGKHGDAILDDPRLEAVLNKHGVDLFLSGHHQVYFSGMRGNMRMISNGCLGGGVRKLVGQEESSFKTIVWLEIGEEGIREVQAYTGSNFDQLVDNDALPESIGVGDHLVVRAPTTPLPRQEDTAVAVKMEKKPATPTLDLDVSAHTAFSTRTLERRSLHLQKRPAGTGH